VIENLLPFVENRSQNICFISHDQIKSLHFNYAIESLAEFKSHLIKVYTEMFTHYLQRLPNHLEIQELLDTAEPIVGEHYKYGPSESGLILAISKLFQREAIEEKQG
jgi:hypothetical protein